MIDHSNGPVVGSCPFWAAVTENCWLHLEMYDSACSGSAELRLILSWVMVLGNDRVGSVETIFSTHPIGFASISCSNLKIFSHPSCTAFGAASLAASQSSSGDRWLVGSIFTVWLIIFISFGSCRLIDKKPRERCWKSCHVLNAANYLLPCNHGQPFVTQIAPLLLLISDNMEQQGVFSRKRSRLRLWCR